MIAQEFILTEDEMEAFLTWKAAEGGSHATVARYRQDVKCFYEWLTEDKTVKADTLENWKSFLKAQGFSVRTVNSRISAINGLLDYAGARGLQLRNFREEPGEGEGPELTRGEYQRLLQTARKRGDHRLYLLIKAVGLMGLSVQAIPALTVEAVKDGVVQMKSETFVVPRMLQEELLAYAAEQDIKSGPLFLARGDKPLSRSMVTFSMKELAAEAGIKPEKISPRTLRRMQLTTQDAILAGLMAKAAEEYEAVILDEEDSVAWSTDNPNVT